MSFVTVQSILQAYTRWRSDFHLGQISARNWPVPGHSPLPRRIFLCRRALSNGSQYRCGHFDRNRPAATLRHHAFA